MPDTERHAGLVARANAFRPWDAMSPQALAGILSRGPFHSTSETGCGGSTIVLSHASRSHIAFAIEGGDLTITGLRQCSDLNGETVTFVEGETRDTLPKYPFAGHLDLVLLDGPHAYPLPQLEFTFLFPRLKVGGWLVLDDIQIPSVQLGPDGWERQGMNKRAVLRYCWRDKLRKFLG